jgi:glycosyltransferase involved in cell wall biosynthesis
MDSRIAGPQLRIAEVAKHLRRDHGIETVVVFPRENSREYRKILDSFQVTYHALSLHKVSKNLVNTLKWLLFFVPETLRLMRLIKKEKCDIVHCNAFWQWKGVLAGRLCGKKVVWHLNDTLNVVKKKAGAKPEDFRDGSGKVGRHLTDARVKFFVRTIFRFLARRVDGFILACARVKEFYLDRFNLEKPMMEIQAPVDTEKFSPLTVKRGSHFEGYNGIKIVTVGNVNLVKGIEYFIEAAHELNKTHKNMNLHFFVVGNLFNSQTTYIRVLQQQINRHGLDNVILYGPADNIPALLADADIYVCSSVTEASPLSVWEAMSMEKPVVSTDVGSVKEFIKDNENGFVVPIREPAQLAEKIGVLIRDPDLRESFGKRARQVAVKHLDVKICAQNHAVCYYTLLDR